MPCLWPIDVICCFFLLHLRKTQSDQLYQRLPYVRMYFSCVAPAKINVYMKLEEMEAKWNKLNANLTLFECHLRQLTVLIVTPRLRLFRCKISGKGQKQKLRSNESIEIGFYCFVCYVLVLAYKRTSKTN